MKAFYLTKGVKLAVFFASIQQEAVQIIADNEQDLDYVRKALDGLYDMHPLDTKLVAKINIKGDDDNHIQAIVDRIFADESFIAVMDKSAVCEDEEEQNQLHSEAIAIAKLIEVNYYHEKGIVVVEEDENENAAKIVEISQSEPTKADEEMYKEVSAEAAVIRSMITF